MKRMPEILENAENGILTIQRQLLQRLTDHLKELDRQVNELEIQINRWHKENESSQKLAAIPGVGPITASAMVATIGNALDFKNGRQLAAWLGLVPKQNSSGWKQNLLGISKRGDSYLRTLLIHGSSSVIRYANNSDNRWLISLSERRNKNVVGVANKNARIAWALLAKNTRFDGNYVLSCC